MRILVADGTGALAPQCIVFLTYWGHEVEAVCDGLDAFRRAHVSRPDLVIAGVELPRMNGFALIAALRVAGHHELPVLLVGDDHDSHAHRRAHALGAAGFLTLPLALPELQRRVERLTEARASERGPPRAAAAR